MAVEPGTAVMRISRAADDRAAAGVYFGAVGTRLVRLRRLRSDPLRLDWLVAALLTVVAQLEIWLGGGAAYHQFGVALIALAITAPIAVRRRYPTLVGTVVPVLGALQIGLGATRRSLLRGSRSSVLCTRWRFGQRRGGSHSAP